jgi:hypothetical protein
VAAREHVAQRGDDPGGQCRRAARASRLIRFRRGRLRRSRTRGVSWCGGRLRAPVRSPLARATHDLQPVSLAAVRPERGARLGAASRASFRAALRWLGGRHGHTVGAASHTSQLILWGSPRRRPTGRPGPDRRSGDLVFVRESWP